MNEARGRRARAGIALPLALLVMIVVAMFAALLLDSSVQSARASNGSVAAARAQSVTESALAGVLAAPLDSTGAQAAVGTVIVSRLDRAADSAVARVLVLSGSLRRVDVRGVSGVGSARGVAGAVAYLRVVADSSGPVRLWRLRPVPAWWWSPIP